jgi:hypothetical protein
LTGEVPSPPIQEARDDVLDLMTTWLGVTQTPSESPTPTPSASSEASAQDDANNQKTDVAMIAIYAVLGLSCLVIVSIISAFVVMRLVKPQETLSNISS